MSDSTRRQILRLLRDRDMTAGEIAEQFNMTKPSISHHLNSLKQEGLVMDERKGQNIVYSLNTTVVQDVMSWFMEMLQLREEEKVGNVKQEKRDEENEEDVDHE